MRSARTSSPLREETMFLKCVAALVVTSMLLPSVAAAARPSGFPRFFERGDEVCVQILDSNDKVQETCRPANPEKKLELRQVELGTSSPYRGTWSRNAAATARLHAAQYGDNSRFGTGFALGLFLGLIGTAIAGVVASNSSVEVPPPHPSYDSHQAFQYQRTFAEEVRSDRTSSAIAGGLLGTLVTVGLIFLLVSQSDDGAR
jgi:hypothetical protein